MMTLIWIVRHLLVKNPPKKLDLEPYKLKWEMKKAKTEPVNTMDDEARREHGTAVAKSVWKARLQSQGFTGEVKETKATDRVEMNGA